MHSGRSVVLLVVAWLVASRIASAQVAQDPRSNDPMRSLRLPHVGGSDNIKVLSHMPLGGWSQVIGVELEQELSRPYAYVSRDDWAGDVSRTSKGMDIIDLKDPTKARLIYSWRIPNGEIHLGTGGQDSKYFKLKGRYYAVQSMQLGNGPDGDVGAVVFDVTGLPDTSRVKELGFIRTPDTKGGFHNVLTYKHSDGRVLLFATGGDPGGRIYDMEKFVAGDPNYGMIRKMPIPETGTTGGGGGDAGCGGRGPRLAGYHDYYVGYDPANKRDVLYGAGTGGYYVYDVSKPEEAKLLASVTGISGVSYGHTFTPTPDGRYAVTETEYQYTPLRIFDLKPALDGTVKTISRPVGAWIGTWDGNPHNHQVRWPYVFVAGYMDGIQVFNIMDPANPYTVGYHYTCQCILPAGKDGAGQNGGMEGASHIEIRNADGLIVMSDRRSGFWVFRMDGFAGWNGHQWGMPNVSSAQDWDNGPDGAPKPTRVSGR